MHKLELEAILKDRDLEDLAKKIFVQDYGRKAKDFEKVNLESSEEQIKALARRSYDIAQMFFDCLED